MQRFEGFGHRSGLGPGNIEKGLLPELRFGNIHTPRGFERNNQPQRTDKHRLQMTQLPLPLGRLPGDIAIRRGNFSFYFPLTTSIILSVVFTLLLAVAIGAAFWLTDESVTRVLLTTTLLFWLMAIGAVL